MDSDNPAPAPPTRRSSRASSAWIGRDELIASLVQQINARVPLLTLTGPAGIGKSALLQALAAQDKEIVLVQLDDAADVDDVAARVHRAVFMAAPSALGAEVSAEDLGPALAGRGPLCLALDGGEHVRARELGAVVGRWLEQAPELVVVASSRSPLDVPIEQVVDVPPLSQASAAALFLARSTGGVASSAAPDVVERIVRASGGLPLALLLAAGRARVTPLVDIATSMETGDFVEATDARAAVPRHASITAAVQSALASLDAHSAALFACMGALRGEASATDLVAVSGLPVETVTASTEHLVDASLVVVTAGGFTVLPPLRAVAQRALLRGSAADVTFARYAAWAVDRARAGDVRVSELQAVIGRARLNPALAAPALELALGAVALLPAQEGDPHEHTPARAVEDDVRALLARKAARGAAGAPGARLWLAKRLWRKSHHQEVIDLVAQDAAPAAAPAPLAGHFALVHGQALAGLGDHAGALADARRACALAVQSEDRALEAAARRLAGSQLQVTADNEATAELRAGRDIARAIGALALEAHLEASLGSAALDAGDARGALVQLKRGLALAQRAHDHRTADVAATYAGLAALELDELDEAHALIDAAAAGALRMGNVLHHHVMCTYLAVVQSALGRLDEANDLLAPARLALVGTKPWQGVADLAWGILHAARAAAAAQANDADESARELGRAQAIATAARAGTLLASSDDARILLRLLERGLERSGARGAGAPLPRPARAVRLAADGTWFELAGAPRVDLARRKLLASLLRTLVAAHRSDATGALPLKELVRAGWPGEERLPPYVHKNRLHVALNSLRGLGLRDVIVFEEHGYRLKGDVQIF